MTVATTIATLNAASPPDRPELVPQHYDPSQIVTPDDNPALSPAILADLEPSMREEGQQVPGFVAPSADLPDGKLLCLDGHHRLWVARLLGVLFLAFNLGRFVSEEERIRLIFSQNYIRRRMSRQEIALRAARFIELTGATQAEAARLLKVSPPTISRAFGDQRIPPDLKERADLLGLSIRSLVAAAPLELMPKVVDFALTPREDGKPQTRDQIAAFLGRIKKASRQPRGRKPKTISLHMNGRTVTFSIGDKESAYSVAEDLKAIATKLGRKDVADVPPEGWPFLLP